MILWLILICNCFSQTIGIVQIGGNIYNQPEINLSNIIIYCPDKSDIEIINRYSDDFFQIKWNDIEGYMYFSAIKNNSSYKISSGSNKIIYDIVQKENDIKNNIKINESDNSKLSDNKKVVPETVKIEEKSVSNEISTKSDVDINIPIVSKINDKTFIVIIANEKYQKEVDVQYAINDGQVFKEYCEKTLGVPSENIHLVTDASFGNMKFEIKWIREISAAFNGQARLIFYYAGHGMPNEKDYSAYLLPVDGISSEFDTAIKLQDLYNNLSAYPTKGVTVFLDACFSGSIRDDGMLANARGVKIKPKNDEIKGNMIIFSASTGDETAYPYKEKQHGLFTYFLLKKLQETKGNVDFRNLSNYVIEKVKQHSLLVNQKSQTPQMNTSTSILNTWHNLKLN